MAAGTRGFHDAGAASGVESARSAISRHFECAFAPGAGVPGVGCGMGRDFAVLLEIGI